MDSRSTTPTPFPTLQVQHEHEQTSTTDLKTTLSPPKPPSPYGSLHWTQYLLRLFTFLTSATLLALTVLMAAKWGQEHMEKIYAVIMAGVSLLPFPLFYRSITHRATGRDSNPHRPRHSLLPLCWDITNLNTRIHRRPRRYRVSHVRSRHSKCDGERVQDGVRYACVGVGGCCDVRFSYSAHFHFWIMRGLLIMI